MSSGEWSGNICRVLHRCVCSSKWVLYLHCFKVFEFTSEECGSPSAVLPVPSATHRLCCLISIMGHTVPMHTAQQQSVLRQIVTPTQLCTVVSVSCSLFFKHNIHTAYCFFSHSLHFYSHLILGFVFTISSKNKWPLFHVPSLQFLLQCKGLCKLEKCFVIY